MWNQLVKGKTVEIINAEEISSFLLIYFDRKSNMEGNIIDKYLSALNVIPGLFGDNWALL